MTNVARIVSCVACLTMIACGGDGPSSGGKTPTDPTPTPVTPTVATVIVSGATALEAGSTTKLAVEVRDASGGLMSGHTVAWSSSDAAMMSVASDGTVNALHIGTATITATAGGKSGSISLTSGLTPFTFTFTAGTSATEQQLIKDAVQYGNAYLHTAFGRAVTTPTIITGATTAAGCDSRSGNAAFTGAGAATFCVANMGWMVNGPVMKQKIVVHELFHVWQFAARWLGGPPQTTGAAWIIEGSAELVGYAGVSAKGLLPLATSKSCAVKEVADFFTRQPPGLPPLQQIESINVFQTTVGPLYPYSMLAMEQLTATSGIAALRTYADAVAAGTLWTTAFQSAFGTSTTAFYGQFPTYRSGLAVPPTYPCGGV